MSSELRTNTIVPASGANLTLGESGDTIEFASGTTVSGLSAGKLLQVVSANKTDTASTTSESYVSTGIEVSITPSSTSSKILVIANPVIGGSSSGMSMVQLWRDSTVLIQADASGDRGRSSSGWLYVYFMYQALPIPIVYQDSPTSTSSLTYKVMHKTNSASYTTYVNRSEQWIDNSFYGVGASTITAMEIEG